MTAPTLVCLGHAALDHVWHVEAFPSAPTKTPATAYRMQGGGMAFNAAVAAARLGSAVRFVGRVGDDAAGSFLRDSLVAEGIDVGALQRSTGRSTSVSAVVVDAQGQRQIFNHRGDALLHAAPLDPVVLDGAALVLVDPRWPDGAEAALRWARGQGVPSMLDADIAPTEDLRRLVPLADWAAFSEPGLACWAPDLDRETALRQAVAQGARRALVTLGEHGSLRTAGGALLACPAPRVRSRDTTGAGDVFHGALASALAEGLDEEAAVQRASAAAAFKCQRGMGALGAPTRAELLAWMAR